MLRYLHPLLCIVIIDCVAHGATASANWPSYIGIPTPPDIATFSHTAYADRKNYTYDYADDGPTGPVPYRIGPDGPYTHYIDPDHPNATDTNNPHGSHMTPRRTMPRNYGRTLSPGSVVEVHGKWVGGTTITASGTPLLPIIIRGVAGDEPVHTGRGGFFIEGSHIIFENTKFDWENGNKKRFLIDRKDIVTGVPISNIVIRHCEFYNGQDVPTESYQAIRALNNANKNSISNIVIWDNYFHHCGVNRTVAVKNDVVGVSFDANVQYAWVIGNRFDKVAGDAMQVAYDSYVAGRTSIPQHVYFAGNICNDAYENIVDLKLCQDVIISQNEAYHIGPGYGDVGGPTAIPYRYGNGEGPNDIARSNIWTLYNTLHDSNIENGGFNSYVGDDEARPASTYFIGNVVYDCGTSTGAGQAFYSALSKDVHWINNVAWNVPGGFHVMGDHTGAYADDSTTIVNNIVGDVSAASSSAYALTVGGTRAALGRMTIKNNLWHDGRGPRFRAIVWGPRVMLRTYSSFSAFRAAFPGFCVASVEADPQFRLAVDGDVQLRATSPARDAGSNTEFSAAASVFETRYPTAVSFREFDLRKGVRIDRGTIDLGAHEYQSSYRQ